MKSLHVVMATRGQKGKQVSLFVNDHTSVEEVCAFALQYVDPPSFSTSQRIAQAIVRHFAKVENGARESLGVG